MLLIEGRYDARTLHFPCNYDVLLPDAALNGARCPAALWLHDLGEDRHTLLHEAAPGRLVDELGLALILPEGRRSCFLNMAHGPRWHDFLALELIPLMSVTFPVDREKTGVIGKGAGALGALALAKRGLPCTLIRPEVCDADGWDRQRWPHEGEWKGVFEGQADAWQSGQWQSAKGLLLDGGAAAARFDLSHWQRGEAGSDPAEALREAMRFIADALSNP